MRGCHRTSDDQKRAYLNREIDRLLKEGRVMYAEIEYGDLFNELMKIDNRKKLPFSCGRMTALQHFIWTLGRRPVMAQPRMRHPKRKRKETAC
jgi:hypothetical protein